VSSDCSQELTAYIKLASIANQLLARHYSAGLKRWKSLCARCRLYADGP